MSLLKELEELNKPVAALPDLEDYDFIDNKKLVKKLKKQKKDVYDDSEEEREMEEEESTSRRRIVGNALELEGTRYEGESVSRHALFGETSEMTRLTMKRKKKKDVEWEEEEDEEELSHEGSEEDEGEMDSEEDEEDGDEEESGEEDRESGEEMEGDEKEEKKEKINMKDIMKPISQDDEAKKGESVRKQLAISEQVLLLTIKQHGSMRAFNQLPRGALARSLVKAADEKTRKNLKEAKENAHALVAVLMEAERLLLAGSAQTTKEKLKKAQKEDGDGQVDSDDEEIESSEDEDETKGKKNGKGEEKKGKRKGKEGKDEAEDGDGSDDESIPDYNVEASDDDESGNEDGDAKKRPRKQETLKSLEKQVAESEKNFEHFRDSTLSKWDERTRLVQPGSRKGSSKDFSAFDGDVLSQINKILSDKRRLISRTQVKRSDAERIGGDPEAAADVEIFDDDDFYQLLLKDLIERKSTASRGDLDPIEMSRQWLDLQKLRQKRSKKKKVDTKASKGRKIRYTALQKLVNFHPATPEIVEWSHEARNELFRSLFT